jgi:hypothetical protein
LEVSVRRLSLVVVTFLGLATSAVPAHAASRVALVIGNGAYQHVSRLDNPANDARLVARTLQGLGFELIGNAPQLDLDEAALSRVVRDFGNALPGADVALFYYAGHGVQVRGANYLVPIGANPVKEADVDFQMFDANLVLRQMESAGTRLNIVILDACRNNPFGGRGLRATGSGLARMEAPQGTLISFATQPGNVALDGKNGNSPYSLALAEAIRRPGVDIFRTFNEVGLRVSNATGGAQQPWMSLSPIKGEFYFVAGSESPPAAPTLSASRSEPPLAPPVVQQPSVARVDRASAMSGNYSISRSVSGGIHNMRTGPGTRHSLVVSIPAGSSGVALGECREPDDGRSTQKWCRATWNGHSGWISRSGIVGAGLR